MTTAVALQGASQCVSTFKTDTPNAQCQAFCSVKFKKFHCAWCKCRACDFCPKGGAAIEEAARDAPPPFSPPPPAAASPAAALVAAADNITATNDIDAVLQAQVADATASSSTEPIVLSAANSSVDAATTSSSNQTAVSSFLPANGSTISAGVEAVLANVTTAASEPVSTVTDAASNISVSADIVRDGTDYDDDDDSDGDDANASAASSTTSSDADQSVDNYDLEANVLKGDESMGEVEKVPPAVAA